MAGLSITDMDLTNRSRSVPRYGSISLRSVYESVAFSLVLDHLLTTALRQGLELPLDLLLLLVLYPQMMILLLLRDLSLPPPLDLEPYEGEGYRSRSRVRYESLLRS